MGDPKPPRDYVYKTQAAAQRMWDVLNLHKVALSTEELAAKRWVAIRLSDGGSDNIAYDTRRAAFTHQLHPTMCLYLPVDLRPLPPLQACDVLLWYIRRAYDNGWRPDEDRHDILPQPMEMIRDYTNN